MNKHPIQGVPKPSVPECLGQAPCPPHNPAQDKQLEEG